MTQDLYYVESGYLTPDAGYYVYTADAEAAVSSAATISCDATKIAGGVVEEGSGNLTLVATMTVMISHIHGADLVAFSNAAIGIQINVIKSTNVALTSVFSAAIDAVRGIYVSAQADAAATISISNQRVRFTEAAIDAAFALVAISDKIQTASANLDSTASTTATAVRNRYLSADISSTASLTSVESYTRGAESTISCQADLTANNSRIREFNVVETSAFSPTLNINVVTNTFAVLDAVSQLAIAVDIFRNTSVNASSNFGLVIDGQVNSGVVIALESQSSLTATVNNIKQYSASLNAFGSELAVVVKTGQGLITIDCSSSLAVNAEYIRSVNVSTQANSQLTANNDRIRFAEINLVVSTTLTTVVGKTTNVSASLTTNTALTCNISKFVGFIALEAGSATLTVIAGKITPLQAHLSVLAFELVLGVKTTATQAVLVSTSTMVARVGGTFGFRSTMQGFAAEVVVADIIHIDAKLTWMIFAEDRDYSISAENRTYSIVEEDRDYMIVQEDREHAVTRELLTTELQGV